VHKLIDANTKQPLFVSRDFVVQGRQGGAVLYAQGQRFLVEGEPEAIAGELAKLSKASGRDASGRFQPKDKASGKGAKGDAAADPKSAQGGE
jgi:hypothetical protein